MYFQQAIYIFTISSLIKSSFGVCELETTPKQFCAGFMENGTCQYEMKSIDLLKCFNEEEITGDIFGELENIKDIQYLSLSENDMGNINGCAFEDFSHLLYLNLSHNKIRVLSDVNFKNLLNVKIVDLSYNKIRLIDDHTMEKMINLEELYLNNNNISEVNNFLGECEKLKILDISNNKISNLDFLQNCSELIQLQISKNTIQYLKKSLFLPKLMFLDMSNNKLRKIDTAGVVVIPNLRFLDLSRNSKLFNTPGQLIDSGGIQLESSEDEPVPFWMQTTSTTFTPIQLFDSDVRQLEYPGYERVPLMTSTSSSNFKLFKNISLLNTLKLSNTGIEELAFGAFFKYTNLEILDLSNNGISELPNGIFFELVSLKKLYLNGNKLKRFEYDDNPLLTEIDLNDNEWNCGDLLNFLRSLRNVKIIKKDSYVDMGSNIYGINCKGSIYYTPSLREVFAEMKNIKDDIKDISTILTEWKSNYDG